MSIRTIDINSPIGKVQFYIIKADTSFLLFFYFYFFISDCIILRTILRMQP